MDDQIVLPASERMEKENSIGSDEFLPVDWKEYSILRIGLLMIKMSDEYEDLPLNDSENVATTNLPGDVVTVVAGAGEGQAHETTSAAMATRQQEMNDFLNGAVRLSLVSDKAAFLSSEIIVAVRPCHLVYHIIILKVSARQSLRIPSARP